MARKSSHRPDADKPEPKLDQPSAPAADEAEDGPDEVDAEFDTDAQSDAEETDDADKGGTATKREAVGKTADRGLWEQVRIDPIEVALPAGVGYTLRAYRPSSELTPTDISDREVDDPFASRSRPVDEDDDTVVILDEEFAAALAEAEEEEAGAAGKSSGKKKSSGKRDADDKDTSDEDDELDDVSDEDEDEDTSDEDEEPAEEVPVFLSHRGRLLLFKTPESLVSFVRSGAPNDLAQLDTWSELVERIEPGDIAPLDEDSYELDLVVENLRGGHDVWDPTLLIEAGEAARDVAYALRLTSVLDMLSTGSSLDDLDEALRATVNGGLSGFLGRRKLKKIGAQTASLGWRTIIGKISAAVDWRD